MRIGLLTEDDAFYDEVVAHLADLAPKLRLVRTGDRPGAVALLLVDSASALSPTAGPIPTLTLRRGPVPVDGPALDWPPTAAALEAALTLVGQALRQQNGIASPGHLAAGMARIAALASESVEITDRSVRLLYVNPAFEEITGWPLEEAVGYTTGELFRAGTHDPAYYAEIMRTLQAGGVWRGPLIGRRRDGELSFQEATLAPIPGEDGAPIGYVAIKRDVARDALAAQALESRERRLQTMLEGAGDGVLVHDEEGVLVDVNASAAAMLGVERAALLATGLLGDFFELAMGGPLSAHLRGLQVGAPITLEGHFRRPEGPPLPVSLRLGAFTFGGERFILALARDVSERVELERRLRQRSEELAASLHTLRQTQHELVQREKLAALGGLVAGIAHEVNTPLGVTLTAVSHASERLDVLREALTGPAPSRRAALAAIEDLHRALGLAVDNARRAADLVSDFKKVAVDQTSEVEREIELFAYIGAVLASLSPMVRAEGVRVHLEGEPLLLRTRPGAIAQIVSNAISNAVMHAFTDHPGPREVFVTCRPDQGEALIEIADRGVGIPAALHHRVFEPFFTTRMGNGGTGLGMHIVHSLVVDLLGGRIQLRSAPGAGTTVSVRLPCSRAGD